MCQSPTSLEISPDSVSLAVGETAMLNGSITDANGHDVPLESGGLILIVSRKTSDSAVATGDDDGFHHAFMDQETGPTATVTTAEAGTAAITDRHGGITGTATNTVTESS